MGDTAAKRSEARKWVVLGATLVAITAGVTAFGETPTPCYEAYVTSGLTEQQMSFEEFGEFYSDTLCASEQEQRET
jgi:hypothetical protein